jgi:hypothetical protein
MRGLPADTDVSFLKGALLIQVCVGQNEVIIRLYPRTTPPYEISIMSTSLIRLVSPDGAKLASEGSVQIAPALLSLLGSTVADVSILQPGTLRLTWSSGPVLDLVDSNEKYESYTITNGGDVIVV